MWERYKPQAVSEVVGQTKAVSDFIAAMQNKDVFVLLSGPSGCGKTSLVEAYCQEKGATLLHLNSSEQLEGAGSRSLFEEERVFLLDNVEEFDTKQINKMLEHGKVVATTQKDWNRKLATLKSKSVFIKMRALNTATVKRKVSEIAEKENIVTADPDVIAITSDGDLRYAFNLLEMRKFGEDMRVSPATELPVYAAVEMMFRGSHEEARMAVRQMEIKTLIYYLYEYSFDFFAGEPGKLAAALEILSVADYYSKKNRKVLPEILLKIRQLNAGNKKYIPCGAYPAILMLRKKKHD